jgi:hypothetical protein
VRATPARPWIENACVSVACATADMPSASAFMRVVVSPKPNPAPCTLVER